jgi:hypothetical protein
MVVLIKDSGLFRQLLLLTSIFFTLPRSSQVPLNTNVEPGIQGFLNDLSLVYAARHLVPQYDIRSSYVDDIRFQFRIPGSKPGKCRIQYWSAYVYFH